MQPVVLRAGLTPRSQRHGAQRQPYKTTQDTNASSSSVPTWGQSPVKELVGSSQGTHVHCLPAGLAVAYFISAHISFTGILQMIKLSSFCGLNSISACCGLDVWAAVKPTALKRLYLRIPIHLHELPPRALLSFPRPGSHITFYFPFTL